MIKAKDCLLPVLLFAAVGRLWLMPLPSSFWVDETGTAFVVHYGAGHPSFAAAPQVPQSIYYVIPAASEKLFGFSEVAYRLPSVLLMALALFLVARLAARLIHPGAAWFAVFACLALRGINYEADDARPYALGICVAAAALLFLVRWLDTTRLPDAALFVLFAALLWRVHLIFWPFYLVFAVYALVRLVRADTPVGWAPAAGVFALLALALAPVMLSALTLFRQAGEHVIVTEPTARALANALRYGLVLGCGGGAWLLGRWFHWRPDAATFSRAGVTLILGWWLAQPVSLFAFSLLTGNSVFVARYYSLALPGTALVTTALVARFLQPAHWRTAAAAVGLGALLFNGQWGYVWPQHQNSDWRGASQAVNRLAEPSRRPVICPSPFIEARPPAWSPEYPLPGFLFAHLAVYPLSGRVLPFPFELEPSHPSPEVDDYAGQTARDVLQPAGRFLIYGGAGQVRYWDNWFARRPELAGWTRHRVGDFGDVTVMSVERPGR